MWALPFVVVLTSRTVTVVAVVSSRTDPDDDVVDVTSSSALDVVEIKVTVVAVVSSRTDVVVAVPVV